MLDHHCATCSSKCDLRNINKSIEDIAKNLVIMKNNYYELELKISRFSQEIPKLEGQIDILEALAAAIEGKESGWDPNPRPIPVPPIPHNVHVCINKPPNELRKNDSIKCTCPKKKSAQVKY
uniref:Uncharacterized protein n=1 Tax=Heliothis virescens TaxID=7102 RepID=A0A2A4J1P1_HELVI